MTVGATNGGPIPELEIEVPAKPIFARTARHAVGAVARLHDAPEDLFEDIKLAVSEACNTALTSTDGDDPGEGSIRVSVWADGDRVLIDVVDPRGKAGREVSGAPADIDTEDLPFDRLLALPIIRGLVDEVSIAAEEGGGIRIRMSVSFPPSGD
jgi:anti-sigma regulatory factor (Ser/Thr protein kinase)